MHSRPRLGGDGERPLVAGAEEHRRSRTATRARRGRGEGEGEGEGGGEEEWGGQAGEDEEARDLETFGGASPGGASGGLTGFMPPADFVAAGGRVRAQELDMAALARQSLGFADATQQVDVQALQQQIRQLQMR